MRVRIISAVVAVALFLPIVFVGESYFALLMWVLGLIGLKEIATMAGIDIKNPIGVIAAIGLTAVLVPEYHMPFLYQLVNTQFVFYISCIILLVFTVFRHRTFNFVDVAIIILGCMYIGYGFRFMIQIRDMGLDAIIYLFLVVWSTDSGAYFVGKRIGKTPLSPEISPNKTIEGTVGGVVIALLTTSLYSYFMQPNIGFIEHSWVLTIVISLFGQFGDLVESAMKRHFEVKDSGKFMPGHGGLLDRFDSLIFASFMMMIWMNLFR